MKELESVAVGSDVPFGARDDDAWSTIAHKGLDEEPPGICE